MDPVGLATSSVPRALSLALHLYLIIIHPPDSPSITTPRGLFSLCLLSSISVEFGWTWSFRSIALRRVLYYFGFSLLCLFIDYGIGKVMRRTWNRYINYNE